jgi:simple sugar transport system ATP-binding protein/ribose transport system ATP-binding protein
LSVPVVEAREVSKRFGGVQALGDVSITIERGTVHGLIGENGAGKSTLGRIVGGITRPDSGVLFVDGVPVRFGSPREALQAGIATISQEVALVPARTVLENVLLGVEPTRAGVVRRGELARRFEALARDSGFDLDPGVRVEALRPAEQRQVEIVRALARGARLVVMDEPTSSLGQGERRRLAATIRRLAGAGVTTLLVSHDLGEVLELADTVTVLRSGRVVRTGPAREDSPATLITAMLGRSLATAFPQKQLPETSSPTVLETRNLTRRGSFDGVSLRVRRGEIVGLAGIVGSGRSEFLRAIFGADRADSGEILIDGLPVVVRRPGDAARHGIALLPERRREQGLVMMRSVRENISLASLGSVSTGGVVRPDRERALVHGSAERLGVPVQSVDARVGTLSGGNQQKTVLAKWLARRPMILLADEPTRGVDVGAKRQLYDLLVDLAAHGLAVLFIASDVEEAVGLAHRLLVFRDGRIAAELDGSTATPRTVMASVFAIADGSRP